VSEDGSSVGSGSHRYSFDGDGDDDGDSNGEFYDGDEMVNMSDVQDGRPDDGSPTLDESNYFD
jgi:hypothetical protein